MGQTDERVVAGILAAGASVLIPVVIFSMGLLGSVAVGPATPEPGPTGSLASSQTPASPSDAPPSTPASGSSAAVALDQLSQLADAPPGHLKGYERDYFGHGWIDTDRNGCDTRNDILGRDLTGIVHKPGTHECVVLSGVLDDPYTGMTINFVRGNATSTLVQIDHIVPLGYVWQVGAANWTEDQRIHYTNDRPNLLAVDGETNQVKSASGPSEWMPPNEAFHCAYVELFVGVLFAYQLEIVADDRATSEQVLAACP